MAKRLYSSLATPRPVKQGVILRPGVNGHELDDYQRAIIADFLEEPPENYDRKNAEELFEKLKKFKETTDHEEKRQLKKEINELDNKITPAARAATIQRDRAIHEGMTRYFAQYGSLVSKTHAVEWLKLNGYATRTYATGRTVTLTDRRLYALLEKVCWIRESKGWPKH